MGSTFGELEHVSTLPLIRSAARFASGDVRGQLCTRREAELGIDRGDVLLNGLLAHAQRLRDGAIGQALRDERRNLPAAVAHEEDAARQRLAETSLLPIPALVLRSATAQELMEGPDLTAFA